MERYRVLHTAMRVLAGQCDGAVARDDIGFNGADTFTGHQMAERPFEQWTERDVVLAAGLLRKYHRQLEGVLDILNFTVDLKVPSDKVVTADRGQFIFQYRYDPNMNAILKEQIKAQGRHFDGNRKAWVVPISKESSAQVVKFALEQGFTLTERAHKAVEEAEAGTVEAIPEAISAPGSRRIVQDVEEISKEEILRVYFPYDSKVVDAIRPFPDRRFEGNLLPKHWVVPFHAGLTFAETILDFADTHHFEMDPGLRATLETTAQRRAENVVMSSQEDAEIEVEGLLGTLRPFQRGGVAYAVRNKRTFIADEQGLGKTIQGIATVQHEKAYPALVICPATIKINWEREFRKWVAGLKIQVVEGTQDQIRDDQDVYIVNYDIFHQYTEAFANQGPQAIIFDESHSLKNSKTLRGKAAMELIQITNTPIVLMLTGTPVLNRPRELWQQLKIMGRDKEFGSEWKFLHKYCQGDSNSFGQDYDGAQNLEELNQRMRATCFIRRLKSNVMKELPAKQKSNVLVQIDNWAEYNRVLGDFCGWLEEQGKDSSKVNNAEVLTKIEYLKQAAARGKLTAAKRWIKDFLESGEKLVVFAHHKEIQRALLNEFKGAAHILGEDSMEVRQQNVDRFQNDPSCTLMIASVKAAGVGLTLTAASNVLFMELGWTPAEHDQAEDRCHRIGQSESVNIYYLIAVGTIDEDIMDLLDKKRAVVGEATDGVYIPQEVESKLFSDFLSGITARRNSKEVLSEIRDLVLDTEELPEPRPNSEGIDLSTLSEEDLELAFPGTGGIDEAMWDKIFGKNAGKELEEDALYRDVNI